VTVGHWLLLWPTWSSTTVSFSLTNLQLTYLPALLTYLDLGAPAITDQSSVAACVPVIVLSDTLLNQNRTASPHPCSDSHPNPNPIPWS
jgi:hypothetical protein